LFDRDSNMHRLWDSDLIEWNTRSEDVWLTELAELDTGQNRAMTSRGTVKAGATDKSVSERIARPGEQGRASS